MTPHSSDWGNLQHDTHWMTPRGPDLLAGVVDTGHRSARFERAVTNSCSLGILHHGEEQQ